MERAEAIIAACRDTMLTTLEKIGGQSLICSWTRRDGTVVRLSLKIMPHNEDTIADAICDMDDEELAKRLIPIVVNQMCADGVPTDEEALKWLQQPASRLKE
jgi:hypothetical protein